MTERKSLLQKRRLVAAVLILSLGVSVAANIGHAQDNLPSKLIAAWPPFALWLAIEGVLLIPVHRKWLLTVRLLATAVVAVVAAVLSYGHMRAVAEKYGEGDSAWLWPLSVDGLVVVMSIGLVQLSGLIQSASAPAVAPVDSDATPTPESDSDLPDLTGVTKTAAVQYALREAGATDAASVRAYLKPLGVEVADSTLFAVIKAEKSGPTPKPELVATNGHG